MISYDFSIAASGTRAADKTQVVLLSDHRLDHVLKGNLAEIYCLEHQAYDWDKHSAWELPDCNSTAAADYSRSETAYWIAVLSIVPSEPDAALATLALHYSTDQGVQKDSHNYYPTVDDFERSVQKYIDLDHQPIYMDREAASYSQNPQQ